MKHRILVSVISILVIVLIGSVVVFAGNGEKLGVPVADVKNAEELILVTDVTKDDKNYYHRTDAPANLNICYEGEDLELRYDCSIEDDFGNVKDRYFIEGQNKMLFLNNKEEVIGFFKSYSNDEFEKLYDEEYLKSITKIGSVEEAVEEAEIYLTEYEGVDISNCELFIADEASGLNVYYIAYMTKVGEFNTENVYHIDVALTGEIFGFNHKASPVPDEDVVLGYSYEDVAKRAESDMEKISGNECTVRDIYAVSLEDGDYFKAVLEVSRNFAGTSNMTSSSEELYYKIK